MSELIRRKDVLAKVVGGGEFAFIPADKIKEIPAVEAIVLPKDPDDRYEVLSDLLAEAYRAGKERE